MKEIKELFYEALLLWEKKRGLFISTVLILGLYFLLIKGIITEGYPNVNYFLLNIWLPLSLFILLFIIWIFSSRRIPLPKYKTFTLGIFLIVDEENAERKIKRIVTQIIKEINKDYSDIKIKLFPINYITTKKDLKRYLDKYSFSIDAAIFSSLESGNFKDKEGNIDEKLIIKSMSFSGKFNVNEKLKIFQTTVSISDELKIRNINKSWSYIESNSLADKIKLKNNFKDSILFYCGLYIIYLNKPLIALEILKTLHSPHDSKAQISVEERKIYGSSNFISAARLNEILLNLFVVNSSRAYRNKDVKKAYETLKECERIFGLHPQSFKHFITLARHSYELDKIQEAQSYTDKAKDIKHYSTEIYLNDGFFGIVNNDEETIYDNYKELSKVYKHEKSEVNFTDVISWLENQRGKLNSQLLEFAIGFLSFCYSDSKLGKKILLNNRTNKLKNDYPLIYKLTNQLLTKGTTKSPYFHRKKGKGKKKKKRKRK